MKKRRSAPGFKLHQQCKVRPLGMNYPLMAGLEEGRHELNRKMLELRMAINDPQSLLLPGRDRKNA